MSRRYRIVQRVDENGKDIVYDVPALYLIDDDGTEHRLEGVMELTYYARGEAFPEFNVTFLGDSTDVDLVAYEPEEKE